MVGNLVCLDFVTIKKIQAGNEILLGSPKIFSVAYTEQVNRLENERCRNLQGHDAQCVNKQSPLVNTSIEQAFGRHPVHRKLRRFFIGICVRAFEGERVPFHHEDGSRESFHLLRSERPNPQIISSD